jgi:L-asparaginase/Glu-tRNA(Gln) amidotransferase subunit D
MSIVTEEAKLSREVNSTAARTDERARPAEKNQHMTGANVAAVFTGGTIAVSANKNTSVVPVLSGREIMERVPEVRQ